MIKVAILGVSGYGGSEVLRILNTHNDVTINHFGANTQAGIPISQSLGQFYGIFNNIMQQSDLVEIARESDCIITATPHKFLAEILTKEIVKQSVIIDLSADFRLKNPKKYEEYYHFTHPNPELLQDSVYGLCEINKSAITHANLIANPGCYPTCSTLCILPLLQRGIIEDSSIIIDAKSGVSGAGRSAKLENLFCEVHDNIKAYGLIKHRHVAEIEQNLGLFSQLQPHHSSSNKDYKDIHITFTPHLIPMNRGILVTAYANLSASYINITQADIDSVYEEFCENKIFVRHLKGGIAPQTRWVKGSNFVDISACLDSRNKRVIMMGAIDNLIKGAAGAAIQNLNLRFGFKESQALEDIALFP
ncbi:N-acetyl-gamma-glutamyl-phosphate reductase [Helicobacter sp. MIT 14-3879]|uniref:N-acetyl-gamma-glutamyl-phosphate reductase n=1 Tax=Helicobacter sp. MIT 14-3879 TaxID=2040649 RepID=UPI000E1F8003|nr:N-acetyl-gamma-glutamyl-phosphate reductase [Helicobacter sp. MIT 14-3879]RDU59789.1 N-acetyl-gamma-glutamyl-phosphate reductase [Helicobacter sp. MIT 14-3879]